MKVGSNLLAGIANSSWSALVSLLVVPQYLKYLGVEAYGLIGFFAMMQAMLSLLDMGMSPTMNREVARHSAFGTINEARQLLYTLGRVYWSTALFVAIAIYLCTPYIADHWLGANSISPTSLRHAITLMGIVIACRWPIGLYQGVLMGKQLLHISSKINMAMVTLGSIGGVMLLAFISPTIEAFFLWQALVGIIHLVVMRWMAWDSLGREGSKEFSFISIKKVWRFSVGMSGIAISSIVLLQLDKVLLSKLLSLEDFGFYSLAVLLSGGLNIILAPLFNVVFPKFSGLVAGEELNKILRIYKTGTHIFSGIIFSAAFMVAFYANEIVYLWLHNSNVATKVGPLLSILIVGSAINGVMIFPYALQLANGLTKLPLTIILSLILAYIPTTYILTINYGMIGGAYGWLILNLMYLFFGTWLMHRYIFANEGIKWIFYDIFLPASISFFVIFFGYLLFFSEKNGYINLLYAGLSLISSILFNYILLPKSIKFYLNNTFKYLIKK